MHHSPGRSSKFARWIVCVAIILTVLLSGFVNAGALTNPPAWDSAVTVSPAALTIVDRHFDVWEVANLPSSPEGGPSTHSTSVYTIGLAALIAVFGPSTGFYVAHLVSIALVGALAGATYLLARERSSITISALAALTVGILPLVVQQAADVYLDLPLAVVTTFAVWTGVRRWFWTTAGLVFLAVAIKTSGVFLLPLLLIAKPTQTPTRRHFGRVLVAASVAVVPFVLVLATTHRFGAAPPLLSDLTLLRSSLSLLLLTIDVFVLLAVYTLVMYGRSRSGSLDRVSMVSMTTTTAFFAVHVGTVVFSGTIAILPRYYIAIIPSVLVTLLPPIIRQQTYEQRKAHLAVIFIAAIAIFSVINMEGDLYPLPDHDFYVAAERSTRAQELLELQVQGTRALVATGLPILAERQVHFRLEYPGMGYVDERPNDITSVFLSYPKELPDVFAMLIERRYTNPLVDLEEQALSQGFELQYETIEVGAFTSQLVIATK